MEKFSYTKFKEININDSFFDSLKEDYSEFETWFKKKSISNESAYIQTLDNDIAGFLYLKIESGPITDVFPSIHCEKAVKIGTMKIKPHGTRLGERFIKRSIDFAIENNISLLYVTVFSKHKTLINLYEKYGFKKFATKNTINGLENVLVKDLNFNHNDFIKNYPKVNINSKAYILSIRHNYHPILFPDSLLNTDSYDLIKDVSHTNSIEKIYICRMPGVAKLKPGDLLVMYRMKDPNEPGYARYKSVATSLCVVESLKLIKDFPNYFEFKNHCKNYSIFDDRSLQYFYKNRYLDYYIIKMTYNIAFNKRLTNGYLKDFIGINPTYWGFVDITNSQLKKILTAAEINTNYFL